MFAGVAGVVIESVPEDVVFGERKRKCSPYDPLLLQLQAAGPGKFLRFDDLRARPSLIVRAKKLGIRVLFGEKGEQLFVCLAKADLTTAGVADEQPRVTVSDIVIAALKVGRSTAGEIVTWARSNGAPGVGISQVDGLLSNLARAGKVKLRPLRSGASDAPDRWSLA